MNSSPPRIPLPVKIAYTAFMAVLIPIYLKNYGATNFLYLCDVAILTTLVGIWLESPVLLSGAFVGIFWPQMLWVVDFMFKGGVVGWTDYMFKPPWFLRFLSFFHFWLPFFLLYSVRRVGYDKRGFLLWTGMTWLVMTICYAYMPPTSPENYPPTKEEPLILRETGDIRGKIAAGPRSSVLVKLLDEKGKEIACAQTQADGAYVFEKVGPGRYRVQLRDPELPLNINYVFNLTSDEEPQTWLDPDSYFALLLATMVLGIYLPTHLMCQRWMPGPRRAANGP